MGMEPIAEGDHPRFLADENFNGRIVAGLHQHYPAIDLLTFAEAGLVEGISDLLARWLPIDRHLPGVLLIRRTMAIGAAIEEIALIWAASRHDEYRDRVVFLPI
jgi:hypothetical protein